MFKRLILLLLIGANLHAMNQVDNEAGESNGKWSTTKKIAVIGAIGVGSTAIVYAPVFLSVGTVVGTKAGAATLAAAKAWAYTGTSMAVKGTIATALWAKSAFIAAPLTTKISVSIYGAYGGKWAKECFYPTPEQELIKLMREEASEQPFEMQLKEAFKKNQELHAKKS